MTLKRLVTCAALAVAAAFPAAASAAQPSIPPPEHDNFLDAYFPTLSHPMRYNDARIFSADTSSYTRQVDMYDPPGSGGPVEPNACRYPEYTTNYGKTLWFALRSKHWGRLSITVSGAFDPVIGYVPFKSRNGAGLQTAANGTPANFTCVDEDQGLVENVGGTLPPGQWIAFQVGGTQGIGDTSTADGGLVQVKYNLHKPKQVGGRAYLYWDKFGRRVTKMYVTGVPHGARLRLRCTKGACKTKTVKVHGVAALGKAAVRTRRGLKQVAGPAAGTAFEPIVRTAGKRVDLKKYFRKVKPGAKIELRITNYGQIGRYYRWTAKRKSITAATTRCMDVGKSRPKKKCTG